MELIQTIEEFAWIGWLVLIAVFLIIEMLSLDFTFLMLSLGSVVGLASDLLGAPIWLQVVIAAAAAALFIFILRPPLLRRLRKGEDPAKSNVEALIGLHGQVVSTVTRIGGQVKLSNGDVWTARTRSPIDIPPATLITVAAIDGATAYVDPTPTVIHTESQEIA